MNNDLVKNCLFYKGEETCPSWLVKQKWDVYWTLERLWVLEENQSQSDSETKSLLRMFYDKYVDLHIDGKLEGISSMGIRSYLLSRYIQDSQGMCTIDDFVNWYNHKYYPFGLHYKNRRG